MPYLLRKIRKARWNLDLTEQFEAVGDRDCPADCVADLGTSNCRLSLLEIYDDRSNLSEVVVALAANSDRFSNLDYALIRRDLVESIAKLEVTEGQTAYGRANTTWHRDLINLSGRRLAELAALIFSSAERRRVIEKDIRQMVRAALEDLRLDATKIKVR